MHYLLLVHIEESFRKWFRPAMLSRLIEEIESGAYDRVIHFTSHINNEDPVDEILDLVHKQIEWAWGYKPNIFCDADKAEEEWIIPSHGHEWTHIPRSLRAIQAELTKANITLGGGYDGECLADMEAVLAWLGISYTRAPEFIYP